MTKVKVSSMCIIITMTKVSMRIRLILEVIDTIGIVKVMTRAIVRIKLRGSEANGIPLYLSSHVTFSELFGNDLSHRCVSFLIIHHKNFMVAPTHFCCHDFTFKKRFSC